MPVGTDRSALPPARRRAARSRRRRRRVAGPTAVDRAGGAATRGPVRPGELDAGRPQGPLRADGRAARRAEPVRRAVSEQDEVRRRAGRGHLADPGGVAGLPRTPRGGTPRRPARRTARLRAEGAAAAHPPRRRDRPPDAGRARCSSRCATRSRPATSPSTARRTSAASRPSSLPAAQWEQVRDAFWARTGFPVDPGAAVERLKGRLSDAFDRFLEGVADNRQVAFDDAGWRLKTDPAEPPDPAQSDRLAELHRWLDARSRTIRLADLLIEVENDLGFSVHFQQPGEKWVDPGEVCALLAAILAHGCNLGPLHHGEGRARHRLPEAQVRQRLASRRGEPARRARRHRPWHLPPRRRRPLGRRHDVGQRRAALRHAAQGAATDL